MSTTATATTPQPSVGKALRSIRRIEVGPMYFFVLLWDMFVAADHVSDLWQPAAILAFLINGLSLFSGFVINSYSDYPIDIRSPIKNHVAHGVDTLGHRRVLILYSPSRSSRW
jgi:4-hydroxybenzoate polyprenyltransferase